MTRIKIILSITFAITMIMGCEEFEPNVAFEEPISGRTINLSNKIGESFQVLRENDTISYFLSFDRETDLNYIIRSDWDTIFTGTITKRNELYLLNRALENGSYSIHALLFTDSTVTGLETEEIQSSIIKYQLESGKYANLITDTNVVHTIKAEKKDGKEMFRSAIRELNPERLILAPDDVENSEFISAEEKLMSAAQARSKLVTKAYPNPFIDHVNVELHLKSTYLFKVFSISGKLEKTVKLNTNNMQLYLTDLDVGQYVLKVLDTELGGFDEVRLIKK